MGGFGEDDSSVWEFKLSNKCWNSIMGNGDKPQSRMRHCGAVFGDKWFIYGGRCFQKPQCLLASVYEFDFTSFHWRAVYIPRTSLPWLYDHEAITLPADKGYPTILVMGGNDDSKSSKFVNCSSNFHIFKITLRESSETTTIPVGIFPAVLAEIETLRKVIQQCALVNEALKKKAADTINDSVAGCTKEEETARLQRDVHLKNKLIVQLTSDLEDYRAAPTIRLSVREALRGMTGEENAIKSAIQKSHKCYSCYMNTSEVAFVPCGHICVCVSCSEKIISTHGTCPVCQFPTKASVQINSVCCTPKTMLKRRCSYGG